MSSFNNLATSRVILSVSASDALPTSWTISKRSSSSCKISLTFVRSGTKLGSSCHSSRRERACTWNRRSASSPKGSAYAEQVFCRDPRKPKNRKLTDWRMGSLADGESPFWFKIIPTIVLTFEYFLLLARSESRPEIKDLGSFPL